MTDNTKTNNQAAPTIADVPGYDQLQAEARRLAGKVPNVDQSGQDDRQVDQADHARERERRQSPTTSAAMASEPSAPANAERGQDGGQSDAQTPSGDTSKERITTRIPAASLFDLAQFDQAARTAISSDAVIEFPAGPGDQILLPGIVDVPIKLERNREFFPTPSPIATMAITRLLPELAGGAPSVLDAGAGLGVWGLEARARWPGAQLAGVDLPGVEAVDGFDRWIAADFLEWAPFTPDRFDLIVSNPPFTKLSEFIEQSHRLLKPGGYMVYFLRQAVRAGIERGSTLWRQYRPQLSITSSRRPSFTGDGVSDPKTEYIVFVWQEGYTGPTIDADPFDYEVESTWPDRDQLQSWIALLRAAQNSAQSNQDARQSVISVDPGPSQQSNQAAKVERPLLRYMGGKWRLAPWIIDHFPDHKIYVEPFGGAASVLLRKERSTAEIYNDLDGEIVNLFRVLRDPVQCAEMITRLRLTPFARDEFAAAYEPANTPIDMAIRLLIRSWMGINNGALSTTGFRTNVTSSNNPSMAGVWRKVIDHLPVYVERLRAVTIENRPAIDVITGHDTANTLFYVDPPYPTATRKSGTYNHEMSDADHRELSEVLRSVKGKVVISGYACELYDLELYHDWHRFERKAITNGNSSARTEILWLSPNAAAEPEISELPLFSEVES